MKPWELLERTRAPDGTELTLSRHDNEYMILADGQVLMSSREHGSEVAMAALACCRMPRRTSPAVLVGGLGMGFTLRATLDLLPPGAMVVVSELMPAVVDWNRGTLGALAAHPLRDSRVRVDVGDVAATLRSGRDRFDAVLLDVDNGPAAAAAKANDSLYSAGGLATIRGALTSGGVLAVWSAADDLPFEHRLRRAGFVVDVEHVRGHQRKGPRHTILLGRKPHAQDSAGPTLSRRGNRPR